MTIPTAAIRPIWSYNTPLAGCDPVTGAKPVALGAPLHVADLDGSASSSGRKWQATVMIIVHDVDGAPVSGATVQASWNNGYRGTGTCVTDAAGQCGISTGNAHQSRASVTLTVDDVTHSGYVYQPAANADPDGDSDGTTIVIQRSF